MTRPALLVIGLCVLLAAGAAGMYLSDSSSQPTGLAPSVHQIAAEAKRAVEAKAFADCLRLTRRVADDQPGAAEVRLWEGIALWNLDRWQAAEESLDRAIRLDPQVPEAGWRLLVILQYEHRYIEAEELVLRLYPLEPDLSDRSRLLLELIRQDHERAGPDATIRTLEPVLAHEPTNYHAVRAVGVSYVQLGRIREGAELIERANQLRPAELESCFAKVWFFVEAGQVEQLGEIWSELPDEAWEQARFHRYRGSWAEAASDPIEAERSYRAALERDPADRKAHYQLARLLRAVGRGDEAEWHESEARELDEAREQMATVFIRTKQAGFQLTPADCVEFSQLYMRLGRARQAARWEEEATRYQSLKNR